MLATIKSSYFTKNIFFILDEKRKLKLIKYNKYLQHKLNIDLINYILFSNKFIVYENKTKGNEYLRDGDKPKPYDENSDNRKWRRGKKLHPLGALIYEGEFLNGERNGKGKELGLNTLKFEGEYLNGKRNGKGKEYYDRNIIKFEGEYLKGKRWNGKKYDYDKNILYELHNGNVYIKKYFLEKLVFEGEYLNGEKNGIIKEYDINGNIKFEGEYLNGKRNGKGKEYYKNHNLKFEGEYFKNKRWNGKGYDLNNNIIYELQDGKGYVKEYSDEDETIEFEGEYLNGEKNGKGKEYYDKNILKFEGEYSNGFRNGKGKEYYCYYVQCDKNPLKFEGEFLNGKRNGKGKEFNKDGELEFEGEYLYGYRRKGKEYVQKRLEYEGEYLFYRKWNGKGFNENGNVIYAIKNGKGKIKEYYNGYLMFEGEYLNGTRNGKGKEFNSDGELEFEGEYSYGFRLKGYEYFHDKKIYREYFNGFPIYRDRNSLFYNCYPFFYLFYIFCIYKILFYIIEYIKLKFIIL